MENLACFLGADDPVDAVTAQLRKLLKDRQRLFGKPFRTLWSKSQWIEVNYKFTHDIYIHLLFTIYYSALNLSIPTKSNENLSGLLILHVPWPLSIACASVGRFPGQSIQLTPIPLAIQTALSKASHSS